MTNQLNRWEEELAKSAAETTANLPAVSVPTLSFKTGGRMALNGAEIKDSTVDVIVLDFIRENQFFADDYDPDNPATPCCYAFGHDEKTMKPFDAAPDPQADQCKGCKWNEFGSATKGAGKACKNVMRVALIHAQAEDIAGAEVIYAKIPVTSVKNFVGYAKTLADSFKRPPFAFVTRITCEPDPKTQLKVLFELVKPIEGDDIGALIEKRKTISMANAYPEIEAKPKKARTTDARPGGRFRR